MDVVREFNQAYTGEHLKRIAFPMGGIGAGMVCLEGGGTLSHVSLRHHPEVFHEPLCFAALCVKDEQGNLARVLEGPVPRHKPLFPWGQAIVVGSGSGAPARSYGLPRFEEARFEARFPVARVNLRHSKTPLDVDLTGWSPFIPGNADDSSLPVAALEYRFVNNSRSPVDAVFSFHSANFMLELGAPGGSVLETQGGFVLWQPGSRDAPQHEGAFSAVLDDPDTRVNCRWFRGGWFDPLTMTWKTVREGAMPEAGAVSQGPPSAGGSLYLPFSLEPGEERSLQLLLAWYVPHSDLRTESSRTIPAGDAGVEAETQRAYRPWYAGRFESIGEVNRYWAENYRRLRDETQCFSDCFYDTTLPPEVVEAVAANLIDPQVAHGAAADGRAAVVLGGLRRSRGLLPGILHPRVELRPGAAASLPGPRAIAAPDRVRTRARTNGAPELPQRPAHPARRGHDFHAAADGQLGGIMKVHRDWRISGDTGWLERIWPRGQAEPGLLHRDLGSGPHRRRAEEPHHNTYDIEFWGPDGHVHVASTWARSSAAVGDGRRRRRRRRRDYRRAAGEGPGVSGERSSGTASTFIQKIQWKGLRAPSPLRSRGRAVWITIPATRPRRANCSRQEGPKYQYGRRLPLRRRPGRLDGESVRRSARSSTRRRSGATCWRSTATTCKSDLSDHANPQRSGYAFGHEGGLLLCTLAPRAASPPCPLSTATRCGPASSTRWPRI